MPRREIDPTRRLARALIRSAEAAGCGISIAKEASRPWQSATFTGAWHEFTFTAVGDKALERWLEQLPSADLRTPGHLVADITVSCARCATGAATVLINALTVLER